MFEELIALFYLEDGINRVLQNVGTHLLNYEVLHARQHDLTV
jgi:hypothetical protein